MSSNSDDTKSVKLTSRQIIGVTVLSIYCVAAIAIPIYFFVEWFDKLFPTKPDDLDVKYLVGTTLLMGVLGSALRGMSRLFKDVGQGKYKSSWGLSILLRPFEGAGIALVSYFAITAGIILLTQDGTNPNTAGYLFIGILSGMFSHRAADALKNRFDQFWGASKQDGSKK